MAGRHNEPVTYGIKADKRCAFQPDVCEILRLVLEVHRLDEYLGKLFTKKEKQSSN